MNDLLRAASVGSVNDKKGYFINIAGIAEGIVELTDDEAALVERIINPDNWATKKYLSDKQVDIINFDSPIKQSMLSDAVEFFNRRDGLDSTEFDYVVHEEDRDDYTINKIFEKMRFQGLTGVSYDEMCRTLKFVPKDCYEKILQTSIILKDMRLDDVIQYWQAMAYIPNKPYIIVTEKGSPIMYIRPGEYMYHSGGLWSYGYSIDKLLNEGDRQYICFDSIRYITGAEKDKNCEARLSSDIGLYLSWLSFAIRLAESESTQVYLLYNNLKALMVSWAKYLKYTTNIDLIKNMDVSDIVDAVYSLSIDSRYKVNFYEVREDDRWNTSFRNVLATCENILSMNYPKV